MLSALDGSIIVNTTNYVTDVYQQWNVTTQANGEFVVQFIVRIKFSIDSMVILTFFAQCPKASICPLFCARFRI